MCGIAGVFGRGDIDALFARLFASLSHRGPDDCGIYRHDSCRMGMHRLKFRGPDTPLPVHVDGSITAYNGQVYGYFDDMGRYADLPDGLSEEISASLRYGASADGMYACSTYSPQLRRVSLMTDPNFIKPLFYRKQDEAIVFASEFAPLLLTGKSNRLNADALAELFSFGWYLSDQSYVDDIALVSRNGVCIEESGVRKIARSREQGTAAKMATESDIRSAIRQSVLRSTQGAGPLGLALSGGLDSSILAWVLNDLHVENLTCVTVQTSGVEDGVRCLDDLGLPPGGAWTTWKHVTAAVDDQEFIELFATATRLFGQPTTMSSLALYLRLAHAARAAGVRALILGEGVDEYFAGYSSYANVGANGKLLDYYRHPNKARLLVELLGSESYAQACLRLLRCYGNERDLRCAEVDLRLTRLLLRADVCLMSESIEGRVPFLHGGLTTLANSIPWHDLAAAPGKVVLRRAYAPALAERAMRAKVRFKSPDEMLIRTLGKRSLQSRIAAGCGPIFGAEQVRRVLKMLCGPGGFDADVGCLLLSMTFLAESGVIDANLIH